MPKSILWLGSYRLNSAVFDSTCARLDFWTARRQCKRWFLNRLPSGSNIDLPMSPHLETIIRAMAAKLE